MTPCHDCGINPGHPHYRGCSDYKGDQLYEEQGIVAIAQQNAKADISVDAFIASQPQPILDRWSGASASAPKVAGSFDLSPHADSMKFSSSPETYVVKASGEKDKFGSGAHRDSTVGKSRPDLIPPGPHRRVADHYAKGVEHYGAHNWALGMPTSRFFESLERHVLDYKEGKRDEDHLAAICFNAMGVMQFENTGWDDMYDWTPKERPKEQS